MTDEPRLTCADIAERLGMTERWVYEQVRVGKFEYTRLGRRIRFTEANHAANIANAKVAPIEAALARPLSGLTPRARRRAS